MCSRGYIVIQRAMLRRFARGCSAVREFGKKEEQCHQRRRRDDQRSGKERAKEFVVELEVHVEHDDDGELDRRHDQKRRNEDLRFRKLLIMSAVKFAIVVMFYM